MKVVMNLAINARFVFYQWIINFVGPAGSQSIRPKEESLRQDLAPRRDQKLPCFDEQGRR